jgi:hypothetical protein
MSTFIRSGSAALALALGVVLTSCGTPGAPQPPSLDLPDPVTDLAAVRAGRQVSLTWTMPKKDTDKQLLKSEIEVRICRRGGPATCEPAGQILHLLPAKAGTFSETLPPTLSSGDPRPLSYFVELKNRKGRSAGLSNSAMVLAGEAPAPVIGLNAELHKDGVALHWNVTGASEVIRLHRKLQTPPPAKSSQGLLTTPRESPDQKLLVEPNPRPGHAIDKDIRLGETYEYSAQRLSRIMTNGKMLELAGENSAPIRVEVKDIFPPNVPTGLVAVATTAAVGAETAIDLSWQPNSETDVAGYVVYRSEGNADWQSISPAQFVVGPAFHDTQVQQGHTYRYAVSATNQGGHESARSAEAEETVPNP